MEVFCGPCPKGLEVAHLDGNRENASLENLRYVTRKENVSHKVLHGTAQRGMTHNMHILTDMEVLEIRASNNLSTKELAVKYGVSDSTINRITSRRTWKHLNLAKCEAVAKGEL